MKAFIGVHKNNYYNTRQQKKTNEVLEVGQGSHDLFDNVLFKDGTLRITKKNII
jgi:hypothetical protein